MERSSSLIARCFATNSARASGASESSRSSSALPSRRQRAIIGKFLLSLVASSSNALSASASLSPSASKTSARTMAIIATSRLAPGGRPRLRTGASLYRAARVGESRICRRRALSVLIACGSSGSMSNTSRSGENASVRSRGNCLRRAISPFRRSPKVTPVGRRERPVRAAPSCSPRPGYYGLCHTPRPARRSNTPSANRQPPRQGAYSTSQHRAPHADDPRLFEAYCTGSQQLSMPSLTRRRPTTKEISA
jgi:hypothetical protein